MTLLIDGVLSRDAHFALVYKGRWTTKRGAVVPVAVKKTVTKTGWYFDRHNRVYKTKRGIVVDFDRARRAFESLEDGDFFVEQRSVPQSSFRRQVKNMKLLHAHGLAPQVYKAWIDRSGDVHFAYTVTQLCDGTVQSVLRRRPLTPAEHDVVMGAIQRLHGMGLAHGSLKPANMGVFVDGAGFIQLAVFIDLGNLRPMKDLRAEVRLELKKFTRCAGLDAASRVRSVHSS